MAPRRLLYASIRCRDRRPGVALALEGVREDSMGRKAPGQLPDRRQKLSPRKGMKKAVETPPASRHSPYSEDGVDRTLVRWMLSLSPAERLQVLQNNVGAILRLRRDTTQFPIDSADTSTKRG